MRIAAANLLDAERTLRISSKQKQPQTPSQTDVHEGEVFAGMQGVLFSGGGIRNSAREFLRLPGITPLLSVSQEFLVVEPTLSNEAGE